MKKLAAGLAGVAVIAGLTAPGSAASRAPAARFGPVVQVTPEYGGGYEPGIVTDRFGNLFVTAHKENAQLLAAPDSRSATLARGMSWAWYSADNGKTWHNLPLGPGGAYDKDIGIEGDLVLDDADHLYFVDTHAADVSFTRWKINGRGKIVHEATSPLVGAAGFVDDRPWITARGDGSVFYLGNEGDKNSYPLGEQGDGDAYGPGRYTVYPSYDGGKTWNHRGFTLNDSGWCKPAADHRRTSKRIYIICGNDGGGSLTAQRSEKGIIWAYVSEDDGETFERFQVGTYNARDAWAHWPTVEVGRDGSVYVLYADGQTPKCTATCTPATTTLRLYRSSNGGETWRSWDVTPLVGSYRYSWLSVAPNGKVGYAVYYRAATTAPWKVYATVFKPGEKPTLTSLDDAHPVADNKATSPPGDFLSAAFSRDNKLNVTWTRTQITANATVARAYVYRDIFFARQV